MQLQITNNHMQSQIEWLHFGQFLLVLEPIVNYQLIELLKEFKGIFAQTYKNLKGTPIDVAQYWIELDTSIPPTHQVRYQLNPNYATIVKQDIDKLLAVGFIKPIESWNIQVAFKHPSKHL